MLCSPSIIKDTITIAVAIFLNYISILYIKLTKLYQCISTGQSMFECQLSHYRQIAHGLFFIVFSRCFFKGGGVIKEKLYIKGDK